MDGSSFIGTDAAQDLIACPQCDALYRLGECAHGRSAPSARAATPCCCRRGGGPA